MALVPKAFGQKGVGRRRERREWKIRGTEGMETKGVQRLADKYHSQEQ